MGLCQLKKKGSFSLRFILIQSMLFFSLLCSAQKKPNIIFILGDDMGYQSIGAFGQKIIKTPNLDQLAEGGMILTNFYTNHICSPSRGSLLTGMHTGNGIIRGNYELGGYTEETERGQMPLPFNIKTLGSELKKEGYVTAVMGKWGVGGPQSSGVPGLHGIDLFYGYLDQKLAHNYYPGYLWRNNEKEYLPNPVFFPHQLLPENKNPQDPDSYLAYTGKVYSGDTINQEAIKFIKQNKHQPFFLELAYTLPHMALQVPEKALEQYKGKFDDKPYDGSNGYLPNQYPRATYAAMISLLDEYVGRIVQTLKENGLLENTLIIFTADNGAARVGGCDPDYFKSSGDLRGRKNSLYEGGIKVPFIAYWPGVIKPNSSSDHLCAIWDIFPTFLDVAAGKHLNGIDGISFLNTLKSNPQHQKQHEYLYWERHWRNDTHQQAVRFGDWKVIKHIGKDKIELYDLKNDPNETNDIAGKNPDIIEKAQLYFSRRKLAPLAEWNFEKPVELK